MTVTTKPYGSWKSPVSADLLASSSIRLGDIDTDQEHSYWIESRPEEGGRNTIMHQPPGGTAREILPAPFNARSRIHEYGGGELRVDRGTVYFANYDDRQVYRIPPGGEPRALTAEENVNYADMTVDHRRQRLILVREVFRPGAKEPQSTIAGLPLSGDGSVEVLVSGNDFYSNPRLSPDGRQLAWLTWNHPNMPWDSSELWVARFSDEGTLGDAKRIAGGPRESIFQPQWSPDGQLYFISDRSNWWNLYRYRHGTVEPMTEIKAEFGLPQWVFGMSTYGFVAADQIICTYMQEGIWHLALLNIRRKTFRPLSTPYTYITQVRASARSAVFVGASPTQIPSIVEWDLTRETSRVLRKTSDPQISADFFSQPQAISFPTGEDATAHAFFYPPHNPGFTAPPGEKPPLIVYCHGGPTGATDTSLRLKTQYWTSRGFAVLDVNYRGSTGYGRDFREQLYGQWGVADVEDCMSAARYAVAQEWADENRLIITGGSAGGFTVLAALTFHDVFKAGCSRYGISDLEILAQDTHKFESRYGERLVAPYPEQREVYRQRSPIHFADRLSCPVIFFQGSEDKVVPPNQAEKMVNALRARGVAVAYVVFDGEGHGFRQAENIKRVVEGELYFYARIFGFELAETPEPLTIENLAD